MGLWWLRRIVVTFPTQRHDAFHCGVEPMSPDQLRDRPFFWYTSVSAPSCGSSAIASAERLLETETAWIPTGRPRTAIHRPGQNTHSTLGTLPPLCLPGTCRRGSKRLSATGTEPYPGKQGPEQHEDNRDDERGMNSGGKSHRQVWLERNASHKDRKR